MKRGVLIGAGVAVVAAAIGFWFLFIRDDAPSELSLDDAVAGITGTSEPSDGGSDPTPAPTTPAAPTTVGSAGLDGTWDIDQADSVVGYRIGEEISGIGTKEAVGRTSQVTGSLTLSGSVIETVTIDVDTTTLESDSGNRDSQLRTRGLETDSFPSASFVLSTPIDLGSIPADGEAVSIVAAGDFTLHGVTRAVEIPLDGTLVNGTIVVVGQLDVLLADYDIDPPVGLRILTIEDQGVFEVQLAFTR